MAEIRHAVLAAVATAIGAQVFAHNVAALAPGYWQVVTSSQTSDRRNVTSPPAYASFILVSLTHADGLDKPRPSAPPITLSPLRDGVLFDMDGDGSLEQVSWPMEPTQVAFLGIDRNANGVIDNGTELFGAQMMPGANWAFTALERSEPNNHDGAIDRDDGIYSRLLLWIDRNRDGRCESGELGPASAVLARIGLGYSSFDYTDAVGNVFENRGWTIFVKDLRGAADDAVSPLFEVSPALRRAPTPR
jgi:hypothetical protein